MKIQFYVRPSRDFDEDEGALESVESENVHLYNFDDLFVNVGDLLFILNTVSDINIKNLLLNK
jgi:hypothetical protein